MLTAATTATICNGEEVAFYANAVAGGSYEFLVDGIVLRSRADSNVYSTTALIANNQVTVRVFDQNTAAAPAGCFAESDAIDILITAAPTLTVTSTAIGNEICEGDTPTFFANASIAGATYDFMINGVSYQNSTTQSFDPLGYGQTIGNGDVIEVTASTGVASCSSVTASLTVLTNAITTVGIITVATPTVCLNDTIPAMIGAAGVASGTVSYQWQRRNQTTTVFTDITGATSQNYTPTVGTLLTTDTFFRRITISNTGTTTCEQEGNTISVLVDNPPAAILTANVNGSVLTAATTATICNGEEVAFYANAVAGGSYEFLVDGIVLRSRADSNVYSTTALIANNQVTVRVFDQNTAAAPAGCFAESDAIDILITAAPTLTVTSTAIGNEICEGDTPTFFANASIAGATYDFMINGVSYQNSTTQSFDPLGYGQTIGNGDVIEVTASTGVASCSSVTASLTVLTNAITTVGIITVATPTVCLNDTIPAMIGAAGVASGTVSYQWQRRNQTTTVFTDITGATSQNYTPTVGTLLTTDTFFRRLTVSDTGTTTCEQEGNTISVLVDNPPAAILTANVNGSVLTAATTATICNGEEVAFYANAVAGGSYEFLVDGIVLRSRADSNVYSTTALIANNQVTVRVFDQNTAAAPAGCFAESDAIDILITAAPTLTVTSTAIGNEICEGDTPTFFANASIAGATYDFMINGVSYQNSTTQSFDPLGYGQTIGNGDVIEVTASTGVASCSSVTASLTVLTNAITTVGIITVATPTVCLNDTIPAMIGAAGVASGTVSYQWQRRNQTTTVFTDITGATSQNYTPTVGTLLTTDTFFRRLTVSDTGTTTCEQEGNTISVLVDNPPAAILTANVNGSVLTAATTATICNGEEVAFYANAVAGGSYEFLVDGIVLRSRADSNVYSTTALIANNQVTVRVFDQNTAAAPAGCFAESDAIDILITAAPTLTVTSTAIGNEICEGDTPTFFANASIAGATYDFMINGVSYQNSTTQSFDPLGYGQTIGNGDVIEVTASTGVASCSSVTASLTVLTNAITTVGIITVATPTVCLNDTIPAMIGAAGVASGTVSYQWQRRNQTTTVFTDITGATSQNYTPTVGTLLTTDTFFRRLTVSDTGTTTCSEPGNTISVLVDNPPAAILTANVNGSVLTAATTATICSGEEIAFYANAVAGGSYEFLVDGILVRPRADSNIYSTTALLANDRVTVRVFDQNAVAAPEGCSAESDAITILITAVPTLTVTSTALGNEICTGDAITFFANASIAGATYDFMINGVSYQNSTTQLFDPLGYGQTIGNGDIVSVSAITVAASCSSNITSITMFENIISSAGTITTVTETICQGQTAPPMIGTDQSGQVSGSLSYQWQVSSDNIFYNNIAFANSQNYTPTSILNTNTFYRRLTVSDTGTNTCSEPSNPIRIRIDNTIIASISVVQGGINKVASDTLNICIDDEIIFYAAPTNVGYSYEFSVNNIAVQVRSSQSSFSTNNLLNNDDVRVEVFNGVVSDTSACSDISEAFNIITSPSPVVTLNSDATGGVFCEGDDILFTASSNFASSTYEFIINSTTYQSSSSNTFRPIGLVPPVSLNDGDIVSVQVIGNPYSGASCSSIATISLTENIIFDPGIIGTITDTICSGDLPSILTEQAGTVSASGAISYRWESSIDSISYNPIPFTNSSTYSPGALVQTTNFIRYTISELNGVICEEPSNILTINVVAPISGGTISPNNQSICNGETPLILEVIGGASGIAISYQWQVSSDGVSFTNITTATSRDYQPPALLESQYYRRQTIGPGGLTSDCSALSSVTFIRVRDIDPGALDPNVNQTYCYGAIPPSLISSMTVGGIQMDATDDGAGTITYQWEMSVDNASWTSISSATNNFYNPPSLTQTTWFRRLARSSVSTDVFCQETTNSIRIEILPDLNAGFVLDDQSICQIVSAIDLPETLVLNASEAITNSVTVQWQRSDNQYRWSDISEQRSANLTFNLGDSWLPTMPVTYYRAVITYVGDPQTSNLEQTSIRFDNNGVGFSGGQNYSIIINGTEYGITSTATDSLDSIGDKFANKVSLENFNVNAEYNSDNNILTIVPLVADTYNVAASTGSPSPTIAFISPINAEFGYKILVQGNTGARLPNTMMESCQVYTDPVAIEVTSPHILNQVNGDNSPQGICEGDSIDPITFNFGGGATSIEIQGLDDGLTITPGAGGTVTTNLYGLDDWYEVSGTNSFTISGNINGNSIVNLLSVGIDGCTVVNESYEFRILPNGIVPDFIRMGTNAKGFEVINQTIDGVDYWFNNTVCQDNLPAPTTPETEFFACYLDNELNSIFYQYFWDFEPPTAGNMIQNTFTQYSIGIIQNASTNTLGVDYVISVNASGTSQTYSITTNVGLETADQVGLALANLINTNPNVSSYYNNQIDEITIESRFANMVYTSSSSPTGVNQSLRLTPPAQRDIIRSGTMQWNPSFSGTSTIRVRAVGCDVSDWLEVQIDVVPQALVNTPTVSSLIEPVALNVQVCGGEFTGALPTCEITDATPSTQFFTASDNGNLPNEFDSLEWNISNPQPGAGSLVANPGLIDQLTGTIDWNTGWWGIF